MSFAGIHTQVGGKYSSDDTTVFDVKRLLRESGFIVRHPIADSVIAVGGDTAYAFDPSTHSFKDIETDYYASIGTCAFHTVANLYQGKPYLGQSASLEVAYALCFNRPVLAIAPLVPNEAVDGEIRKIVELRSSAVNVVSELLSHDTASVRSLIESFLSEEIDYDVNVDERTVVIEAVDRLLTSL